MKLLERSGSPTRDDDAPRPGPWRGLIAGMVGGLAGTLAMAAFETIVGRISHAAAGDPGPGGRPDPGRAALHETDRPPAIQTEADRPATARVARSLIRHATGWTPTGSAELAASHGLHYAAGSLIGGLYGLGAEVVPVVSKAKGVPFGVALSWAIDHEALPRAGLSANPWLLPPRTHAYGLAAHLTYAVATEAVRSVLRPRI